MSERRGVVSGHHSLGAPRRIRDLAFIYEVKLKLKTDWDGFKESVRFRAIGTEEQVEAFMSAVEEMTEEHNAKKE